MICKFWQKKQSQTNKRLLGLMSSELVCAMWFSLTMYGSMKACYNISSRMWPSEPSVYASKLSPSSHHPAWCVLVYNGVSWWRHQMETFSVFLAFRAGNSPVIGEFTTQRPVTRSFDVFYDLRLNQQLSKQLRLTWFETPSRSLWRHSSVIMYHVW